jgi:hypothetical protein
VLGVATGVDDAPHALNFEGITANYVALTHIFDHQGDGARGEGDTVGFANPVNAAISCQLDKDKVRATIMGRRILHDVGFHIGYFHNFMSNPDNFDF